MTFFDSCHFLFIPLHKWGKWSYHSTTDVMWAEEDGGDLAYRKHHYHRECTVCGEEEFKNKRL